MVVHHLFLDLGFLFYCQDLLDFVLINFTYIGNIEKGTVSCMHGPTECRGDKDRLCMQKLATPQKLIEFANCQDSDRQRIPDNSQETALACRMAL